MTDIELALECVKLAVPLVSPTMDNRVEGVAQTSARLYSHVKSLADNLPEEDSTADKPMRRTRKPREQ